MLDRASLANACRRLHALWINILPLIFTVFLVYTLARYYTSVRCQRSSPPTEPSCQHRGKNQAAAYTPTVGPFQLVPPLAHSSSVLYYVLQIIDNVIKPMADVIWSAADAVISRMEQLGQTFPRPTLHIYVAPIQVRVRQGIAQVSSIQNALTPTSISCRYVLPAFFLLALSVALILIADVSIGLACLVCVAGYMAAVAGDRMGADDEDEPGFAIDSGPRMNARLVNALHGQT
ncbi:hypothetical protein FRC12_014712 [Ceratobasidium sp. 428]|nr:hypothetical protein FRC12_014712 [Ceratobasidium sp. 428]